MNQRILIICTGNSCRSQMAEGFLKTLSPDLEVHSAGTWPSGVVHPRAIAVMKEIGIDISSARSKSVDEFLDKKFDYVITVCDNAKETCPVFTGKVEHRLHMGFEDPVEAVGSEDYVMGEFRRVRDDIRTRFRQFYEKELRKESA